jgi:uncharacterized protein
MIAQTADSIVDVPADSWNELAAHSNFYNSSAWLRLLEESDGTNSVPRYHMVWDDSRLVAALPSYIVHRETNQEYNLDLLAGGYWQGKYLIAGNRRAYLNEMLIAHDLSPGSAKEAVGKLVAALRRRCVHEGCSGILFPYVSTRTASLLRDQIGCHEPVLLSADSVIDPPGSSMEDYFADFSASRRYSVRRECRDFQRAGFEVGVESLSDCHQEAGVLLGNLQRRHGNDLPTPQWQDGVRVHADHLANYSSVFTAREQGKLVGFALGYRWGDTITIRMAGFDYDRTDRTFAYFNLVCYEPIRLAYAHGLRHVHLGRETYAAKVGRGARLTPLWGVALSEPTTGHGHEATTGQTAQAHDISRRCLLRLRAAVPNSADRPFADAGWTEFGLSLLFNLRCPGWRRGGPSCGSNLGHDHRAGTPWTRWRSMSRPAFSAASGSARRAWPRAWARCVTTGVSTWPMAPLRVATSIADLASCTPMPTRSSLAPQKG